MANAEHLSKLKEGVKAWNKWRNEYPDLVPDLSDVNLSRTDLYNVHFSGANLSKSYLYKADLRRTDFRWADLSMADLSKADLRSANLSSALIINTIIEKALMSNTKLANLKLNQAKGLDKVHHEGPSSLAMDTIKLSEGKLPDVFLRGCGLSDLEIEYSKLYQSDLSIREIEDISYRIAHLRFQSPLQFYSCFISHSTKDAEFASKIYSDLQENGVRCWFAPEDMKGGKKIYSQIDEAIKIHDKLILILSQSSINSPWVATEIKRTRKYESQKKRQRLFPISLIPYDMLKEWELFDADTGTDLAAEIRSYFIPDFSNWKNPDSYDKAFSRLLSDLKAE